MPPHRPMPAEDLEVAAEAADGLAAVEVIERDRPDLALVDVRIHLDGIEATRRLVAGGSPTRIVILTTFDVSETTVKTHVGRVLHKLRLRDRVQAVVFAYEHGIVRAGSG